MLTQLNPPLPLETTKGAGLAHFVIDYGPESNLLWVVFMDKDGACWTVPNPEVRMTTNWTLGRRMQDQRSAFAGDQHADEGMKTQKLPLRTIPPPS